MPNGSAVWFIAPRQQLWTRVVVVLPRRRRRSEQTPVNLIFVAAAGLWHNLFNKLRRSFGSSIHTKAFTKAKPRK
jgi:hypothetical protein